MYFHRSCRCFVLPAFISDIKSTSILLDEKYQTKVSDFGTPRSITFEQTHLTAQVLGTCGISDPDFFGSSQFTEKSVVYSFGVVLVVLLIGTKPMFSVDSEYEERSLAAYFLCEMKENRLFEILDTRVLKEGEEEEIIAVANPARIYLKLKWEEEAYNERSSK
ncbi:hypothetical protein Patl1_24581 [Pistacia atlantica]|uniref:Uncharacterized protein n=1 Tax=Pistacia atlantica TaxID=434234 RepID=A0ACC0ZZ15_9ROSI|nr:hypothetical protein Patl1_24581 [Pistacia atlantica]